ncbi:MAG: hypothetical protein IT422_11370 [Pirellulaceae bacterium]|nr:hypothetical protein [Pirellulaceae bacterium]
MTTGWVLLSVVAAAQEPVPAPVPIDSPSIGSPSIITRSLDTLTIDAATIEPPMDEQRSDLAIACLRIPASLITDEASRSFQHTAPVDRVVLGTHARGTAECQGEVRCEMGQQPSAAELVCHISGTVRSQTCGTNGPALINSTAETSYTATKRIVFDGRQLTTQPAVVNARTQIQITGIGSIAPRLRGRIVERVATRRAADSRLEAERITCRLTADELQQHIDNEFSQRIVSLNRKLAMRLAILDGFKDNEYALSISSRPEYIQILYARRETNSQTDAALPNFPLGDKLVLWIPLPDSKSAINDEEAWGLEDVKGFLPLWLYAPVSRIKAKIDESTPRLDLLRHSNWIGFEFGSDAV